MRFVTVGAQRQLLKWPVLMIRVCCGELRFQGRLFVEDFYEVGLPVSQDFINVFKEVEGCPVIS